MPDKLFLLWIWKRLRHVHNENPNVDYMHKLRAIIEGLDENVCTPNIVVASSSKMKDDFT